MAIQTESRAALRELIELLEDIDARWAGPDWNLHSAEDVVDAHRALLHMLEGGLVGMFESDPAHPEFRRIVTPSRNAVRSLASTTSRQLSPTSVAIERKRDKARASIGSAPTKRSAKRITLPLSAPLTTAQRSSSSVATR